MARNKPQGFPDLIEPDWFARWFNAHFTRPTYGPMDVARRIGIPKDAIYGALLRADLDGFRIGSRWRIPRPALREWLLRSVFINQEDEV